MGPLRARLSAALKQSVDDGLWDYLEEEGYVEDAYLTGDRGFQALVRAARSELRRQAVQAESQTRSEPAQPIRPIFSEDTAARAKALSAWYVKTAGWRPDVRRWRDSILGPRLLTDDEADDFLASPLLKAWPDSMMERLGVPFIHRARVLDYQIEHDADWGTRLKFRVHVLHDGDERVLPCDTGLNGEPIAQSELTPHEVVMQWIPEHYHSPHAQLRDLADALQREYGWPKAEAMHFVLTGKSPTYLPATGNYTRRFGSWHTRHRITLELDAWLPADEVASLYRQAQRQVLERQNRPVNARKSALLRFVIEHTDDRGNHPTWPMLREEWNSTVSAEWRYSDDGWMRGDFHQAQRAIAWLLPATATRRGAVRPESDTL